MKQKQVKAAKGEAKAEALTCYFAKVLYKKVKVDFDEKKYVRCGFEIGVSFDSHRHCV